MFHSSYELELDIVTYGPQLLRYSQCRAVRDIKWGCNPLECDCSQEMNVTRYAKVVKRSLLTHLHEAVVSTSPLLIPS